MANAEKSAGQGFVPGSTQHHHRPTSDVPSLQSRAPQVGAIASQIGELATLIEHLGARIVEHAGQDEADVESVTMDGVLVRELAGKLGYLADLTARACGESPLRGDAPHWLTTPAYRRLAAEDTASAALLPREGGRHV